MRSRGLVLFIAVLSLTSISTARASLDQDVSGSVFATGILRGVDGAVAANTAVVLLAWPPQATLKATKVGDSFPLVRIASTVTGADGRFELLVPDKVDYRSITTTPSDLIADFEILAMGTDSVIAYSFSRDLESDAPTVPAVALQLMHQATERPDALAGISAPSVSDVLSGGPTGCYGRFEHAYPPAWDLVGQVYSSANGAYVTWTYYSGSVATLGVGFSANGGGYGSYKASGSSSVGTDVEIGWPETIGVRYQYLDSQWIAGKYRGYCRNYPQKWYEHRAYDFASGWQVRNIPSSFTPVANYCVPGLAGATYKRTTLTNQTWSDGWNTGPNIGISLESTTGYTNKAGVHMHFTSKRRLCGTHAFPGQKEESPVRLVWKY